jgi:hypothetical protein
MSLLSEFQFSQLENESLKETIEKQKKEILELKKLIPQPPSPKFYLEFKDSDELHGGMKFYYIYNNLDSILECFLSKTEEKAIVKFENFINSYIPYHEELIKSQREDGLYMILLKTYTTKISSYTDLPYIQINYIFKNSIEGIKEFIIENFSEKIDISAKIKVEKILAEWDTTFSELKLKKDDTNTNNYTTILSK